MCEQQYPQLMCLHQKKNHVYLVFSCRMSTDRPKRVTRSLGLLPDPSQVSPSGKVCHQKVLETSDDSTSDSGHLAPTTRSKSLTAPIEKTSASKSNTFTPTGRSRKKKSSKTPELTNTVENSSQSLENVRTPHHKTSQRLKTQVDAKDSVSPQSSHSTRSTRSQVSTSSEDTTPVRRSARNESSSVR